MQERQHAHRVGGRRSWRLADLLAAIDVSRRVSSKDSGRPRRRRSRDVPTEQRRALSPAGRKSPFEGGRDRYVCIPQFGADARLSRLFARGCRRFCVQSAAGEVVIVGGEGSSYSPTPPEGTSWKRLYLDENLAKLDLSRVHFVDRLPYQTYVKLLQVSSVHVYLTYPFVLSWSMLEAMATGCEIVASDTAPVREVIDDRENGVLFPFHDSAALAEAAVEALSNRQRFPLHGQAARETIARRYDKRECVRDAMRAFGIAFRPLTSGGPSSRVESAERLRERALPSPAPHRTAHDLGTMSPGVESGTPAMTVDRRRTADEPSGATGFRRALNAWRSSRGIMACTCRRIQFLPEGSPASAELSSHDLLRCAVRIGLKAKSVRLDWRGLRHLKRALPVIVMLKSGATMVLTRIDDSPENPIVVLQDPAAGESAQSDRRSGALRRAWTGDVLMVRRNYDLTDEEQPFSLGLIVALIFRERRVVRDLMFCAMTLSIFALAPIVFWRLLSDKVIYYGEHEHIHCVVHRHVRRDDLRGDIRLFAILLGSLHNRQGRRAPVGICLRQRAQAADRLFRANASRPDRARHERDLEDPLRFSPGNCSGRFSTR